MNLLKTSLLNAVAVAIKMLTLLGLNKILAIYAGPAGYAAIGQLQNVMQMASTFASGAVTNGVTKYTAQYQQQPEIQRQFWKTAGSMILLMTTVCMLLLWGFSAKLAVLFLQDVAYAAVFDVFAVALLLVSLNAYLLAILQGKADVRNYIVINIAGSLLTFVVTAVSAWQFGLKGALFALAIQQGLAFFVTLLMLRRESWFDWRSLFGRIDPATAKLLFKFMLMAITTAACVPLCQLLIRDLIGEQLSWHSAGMWEAMNRLSAAYLMFVTTTLSLYYLPKLASLQVVAEIRREIFSGYRLILPLVAVAAVVMYFSRDLLIRLLFSKEFLPMSSLFQWQMLGDFLKIGSWLLSYLMLSKAMTRLYISTEIIFAISLYVFTALFIRWFALEGAAMAYAANYFLYWLTMGFAIHRYLKSAVSAEHV